MTSDAATLAVDIGGTKFAAAVVTGDGDVVAPARVPTPPGADADALWKTLSGLIAGVVENAREAGVSRVVGVGAGSGGPMRWPVGEVSPVNIGGWRDFGLRAALAQFANGGPVRVHNDAVAVAVAEHWRGAGRGVDNLLGMVVSTGVGGGLVLGGRLIDGGTGNAGHIGHLVVDPDGPSCSCGGWGCLESIASGPRTVAWAQEQGWPGLDGVALSADARAGDPVAMAALARSGRALGVAIASAVHLCDVDLVVLGGGLSAAGDLLFDPLRDSFARHAALEFASRARILRPALGPHVSLIGAAAFVLAGDRYWSAD
ncbi:MAG: ROK family protein [Sporichthyaceae bacterium]